MKTAQELKEEVEDAIFINVKKDKRDILFNSLIEITKLALEKGIKIKSASMIDYYLEKPELPPPPRVLGIDFIR